MRGRVFCWLKVSSIELALKFLRMFKNLNLKVFVSGVILKMWIYEFFWVFLFNVIWVLWIDRKEMLCFFVFFIYFYSFFMFRLVCVCFWKFLNINLIVFLWLFFREKEKYDNCFMWWRLNFLLGIYNFRLVGFSFFYSYF